MTVAIWPLVWRAENPVKFDLFFLLSIVITHLKWPTKLYQQISHGFVSLVLAAASTDPDPHATLAIVDYKRPLHTSIRNKGKIQFTVYNSIQYNCCHLHHFAGPSVEAVRSSPLSFVF